MWESEIVNETSLNLKLVFVKMLVKTVFSLMYKLIWNLIFYFYSDCFYLFRRDKEG